MLNCKLYSIFLLSIASFLLAGCSDSVDETIVVDKRDNTYSPVKVRPIIDEQQRKAFEYFYQGADPTSGLALEGNDRNDGGIITIGGSGFGLMAVITGVERNWITREQGAARLQKAVHFLGSCERFKGAWSHWYSPNGESHAFGDQVKTGDILETSFMVAGLVASKEYFNQSNSVEAEIRDSIDSFCRTIRWREYAGEDVMHWLWYSNEDRLALDIRGWHEGLETYLFALGAPEPNNISVDVYKKGWQSNGNYAYPNRKYYGYNLPLGPDRGGPMFFAHYSFLGFNPMKMQDKYAFYWHQNVSHAMINRHYCVYEAPAAYKYSDKMWGLTACYGAGSKYNYSARCPGNDDGVIAPTAALASYPYTPFYSTQVLLNMHAISALQGTFGLGDSYNPSEGQATRRHLAIDQAPIVVMIENYRSGLIWDLLMRNEYAQRCLSLAEISAILDLEEGFSYSVLNSETKVFDLMMHPDRERYEVDFFLQTPSKCILKLLNNKGAQVMQWSQEGTAGHNQLAFDDKLINPGDKYSLQLLVGEKNYTLDLRLR